MPIVVAYHDAFRPVLQFDQRAIKIHKKGCSVQQAMRCSGEHWCRLFNHGLYLGRHAARWQGRVVRQSALPPRQAATRLLFRHAMSDFTVPFDQIVEATFDTALSERYMVSGKRRVGDTCVNSCKYRWVPYP